MSKHTPGPWKVYPRGSCVPGYDVCERIVADVMTDRVAHEGPSDADAALIAAAPELAEVLTDTLRWMDTLPPDIRDGSIMPDKIRAALSKAGVL